MLDIKRFVVAYLFSRRRLLALLASYICLFLVFDFLFSPDSQYLHYLAYLSLMVTVLFFIWDVAHEFTNYRQEVYYGEGKAETPLEQCLNEKIEESQQKLDENKAFFETRLDDLLDYYTLWAHQIKTPIAASQLLLREVTENALQKQLEQELFKIDSYTNLVLQYLRLESFHDDLVLREENLQDLVKEVVRKYAIFFIQKGLGLDLHDLETRVLTDKKWLLVIIEQILSNSLKYTKQGGLEIYMEEMDLCIKDTGIGIKDSDVLRVFERGFSGYNGRLTQQSSGLGLYLSKKIAEELGHGIWIESEVGVGTVVRIRFQQQKVVVE